ncbi:hypothetical protein MMC10_008619 [Thelotrema lepadinum]|nr:hypothetical protein [Thelotrema lepadinum]
MSNPSQVAQERIDSLFVANKEWQKEFQAPPEFLQLRDHPERPPAVVIVSCADPRVVPEKYFNFGVGEYLVIRNAGGRTQDAIRSLAVLDQALKIYAVLVVHHTDCGLSHNSNEGIRKGLKERAPDHSSHIDSIDFGEIADKNFDASLKHDVELVKKSSFFSKDLIVKGLLYDLKTGAMTEKV